MAQEIRIEISDEAYAQLQRTAAAKSVPAEEYAGQILDKDLTRGRFLEGAATFIEQHGAEFARRFGGPASTGLRRGEGAAA